ncbi:MAG: hypothetical protein O7B99_14410 [Planctomycetota bacterium]|nr:hypothetical protein [Planctomycetota bacterium]
MARMSNRDRIARAAEEARLAEAEKLAKKTVKKAVKKAAKRPPKPRAHEVRMKIVWVVCNASGKPVKTFAYPEEAAATAEAERLSSSTRHPHEVRATKVPMD